MARICTGMIWTCWWYLVTNYSRGMDVKCSWHTKEQQVHTLWRVQQAPQGKESVEKRGTRRCCCPPEWNIFDQLWKVDKLWNLTNWDKQMLKIIGMNWCVLCANKFASCKPWSYTSLKLRPTNPPTDQSKCYIELLVQLEKPFISITCFFSPQNSLLLPPAVVDKKLEQGLFFRPISPEKDSGV